MPERDSLESFLPYTQDWFHQHYDKATPPQRLGWPAIQRGENTLIFSPTGSGKTMAAFLWGIDRIFHQLEQDPDLSGVQLLYISPLKALNNDIARNLRRPLEGIRATARHLGAELPVLRTAVRTGDTPQSERQGMVRKPPHILITTPESLYLILTSPRAREMLGGVKTVIVDEIHTLCGNKRGVHLSLSLERLEQMAEQPLQRIGLSATQRPLDEVAHYLGGQAWRVDDQGQDVLVSREVTIIDAGAPKALDLQVLTVVPDLRRLPGGSIWPSLIPQVLNDIRRHHTTLVFVNGRRAAERAADRLNEQYALEEEEEVPPGSPQALIKDGVPVGQGMFGTGRSGGPFRAHHGSVSREVRLDLESQLKAGQLPALIATSSLELGIDIGDVDLVAQLQSPRGIARGLQRIGRSGHLVGQTSVGHIYATYREDLLDAAAVAHGMLYGDIEPTHTPQNCLDVLAQQIVAMVSVQDWPNDALYRVACQSYGYRRLSYDAYESVLKMLTGGYPSGVFQELRPRIVWDRVNDRLAALPGSRLLAIRNGGTIADRGEFRVVLPDGKTTLGTLDEEFVYETHAGDVFTLGSNTWRVLDVQEDKIVVGDGTGALPRMPFWHGEAPKRDYHMGKSLGAFRRALAERVADLPTLPDSPADPFPEEADQVIRWLSDEYCLDQVSARNAIHYVRQQLDTLGAISSDTTIIVETFRDALGEPRMAIHCPLGARVNSAWALALSHALRERLGLDVETQVNDDGILFHLLQSDQDLPTDLVSTMGPEEARERLLLELPNSAVFGAQFRMNASRALLLPGVIGGAKRTPFWLQRLRARNLLAAARSFEDFPLITETYRTCLDDVFDLRSLLGLLEDMRSGEIRVIEAETIVPSPVAGSLLSEFMAIAMYEGDTPKAERQIQALTVNRELLAQLLEEGALPDLLRPEAIHSVEEALQHQGEGYRARSPEELAVLLHDLCDLSSEEVQERCLGEGRAWLLRLAAQGRILEIALPLQASSTRRWIPVEHYWRYRDAFGLSDRPPIPIPAEMLEPHRAQATALETILRAQMRTHGPLTLGQISARYGYPQPWLEETLDNLVSAGHLVKGRLSPQAGETQWCERHVLERIHRTTLSLLRKEVQPVDLPAYAHFLLRWQHIHPLDRLTDKEDTVEIIDALCGLWAPAQVWERDMLPARMRSYRPEALDELCRSGQVIPVATGGSSQHARLAFVNRGEGALFLSTEDAQDEKEQSDGAQKLFEFLRQEGASLARDVQMALGMAIETLDQALRELTLSGLMTTDSMADLRRLLDESSQSALSQGINSSLDRDLSAWRAQRQSVSLQRRPPRHRLQQARQRIEQRIRPPIDWQGRWSLVRRFAVMGPPRTPEELAEQQARQLLLRYGIISREMVEQEESAINWGMLYRPLQLMEMRGQVRRGYFVRGLSGMQFALSEAVESLRSWDQDAEGHDELMLVSACDPAVLYGPALTTQVQTLEAGLDEGHNPYRVSRLPSNYLVVQNGIPVLAYEHGGARWKVIQGLTEETLKQAACLVLHHLTREGGLCSDPRRVYVKEWKGAGPIGHADQELLEHLGFRRESPALVWDGL